MKVFLEGSDKTGKSTLAKLIAIDLGCYIEHCAKPKTQDPYVEYVGMLQAATAQRNLVFDRGYLGEYVYSNLWRGGCKITPKEFRALDEIAKDQQSIVIHTFAPEEVIHHRCQKDGEELLQPHQITRCLELFEEIIATTTLPVHKYDSSLYTPAQFMEYIKPTLNRMRG